MDATPSQPPPSPSPAGASVEWRLAAVLTGLLWTLSLALPAVHVHMPDGRIIPHQGFELLMIGWLGVFGFQFGWLANPLLALAALLAILGRRPPIWIGLAALAAGLSSLIPFGYVGANEGESGPASPAIGQWLWLASLAVLPTMTLVRRFQARP